MSGVDQLGQRIRVARPMTEGGPPPLARVLAAIERDRSRSWWARRVAVGRRTAALAIAGTLVAGGVAWAATALLNGASVAPAFVAANPGVASGVPILSSLSVLPIRADDPQGGPPWGMRVIRTTRGLACVQIGRIVDGKLGVLGIGYAFHNDGRFHQLLPQDAIAPGGCEAPDKHGNLFIARIPWVQSASALSLASNTMDRVHCLLPGDLGSRYTAAIQRHSVKSPTGSSARTQHASPC